MKKNIVFFLLSVCCWVLIAGICLFYSEAKRKQDLTNTMHNLRLVYSRIEKYKEKHGKYPVSQSVKTLLKELDPADSNFFRVDSVDINSAQYHAPTHNWKEPVLTIQVRPHIFGSNCRIVMRKNNAYYEPIKKE